MRVHTEFLKRQCFWIASTVTADSSASSGQLIQLGILNIIWNLFHKHLKCIVQVIPTYNVNLLKPDSHEQKSLS